MFTMSNGTIRTDDLSHWTLPPPGALRRGDVRPVRSFGSSAEAIQFLERHGSARMKRMRSRRDRGIACIRLEVGPQLLEALARARYLPGDDVLNWGDVSGAVATVLADWSRHWAD
jgi:hypothetical protein